MKIFYQILSLSFLAFLISCSKKSNDPAPASTTSNTAAASKTCYVKTEKIGSVNTTYYYNGQNKLYKMAHGTGLYIYNDSVIYGSSGRIEQYLDIEPKLANLTLTFDYNSSGNLSVVTYYNAIMDYVKKSTFTFNSSGQVKTEIYRSLTDDSADYKYSYDANGNITNAIIHTYKTNSTDSVVVTYDSKNSIYKQIDNVLRIVRRPYYQRGSNNPLAITVYDATGNVKATYKFDYTYDGDNVTQSVFSGTGISTTTTAYTYDCH